MIVINNTDLALIKETFFFENFQIFHHLFDLQITSRIANIFNFYQRAPITLKSLPTFAIA